MHGDQPRFRANDPAVLKQVPGAHVHVQGQVSGQGAARGASKHTRCTEPAVVTCRHVRQHGLGVQAHQASSKGGLRQAPLLKRCGAPPCSSCTTQKGSRSMEAPRSEPHNDKRVQRPQPTHRAHNKSAPRRSPDGPPSPHQRHVRVALLRQARADASQRLLGHELPAHAHGDGPHRGAAHGQHALLKAFTGGRTVPPRR